MYVSICEFVVYFSFIILNSIIINCNQIFILSLNTICVRQFRQHDILIAVFTKLSSLLPITPFDTENNLN